MITLVFIFAAVVAGTLAVFRVVDRRLRKSDVDAIQKRLIGLTAPPKDSKRSKTPALIGGGTPLGHWSMRLLERFQLRRGLQRLIERANLRWDVAQFANITMGALFSGMCLGWFLLPPPLDRGAPVAGLIAALLPLLYIIRTGRKRLRKFEEQFPDGLEFVARSMRAGHAFSVSLEMLYREFDEPLSGEFRRTFEEQNLGLPLDLALEKLTARMPLLDVQFFVSAVLLQRRTGGNLAEVLDKLATLIRERFKLRGRIRAISAHGRMTGTVLSLIPVGVGVLMFYTNPQYVLFFFNDPTGHKMLASAVVIQLIGYGVIRKIVSIEI